MPAKRYLIVNADDFGHSSGVNLGVIHAHDQGIVTSASLMVRWPAALEAARLAKTRLDLSVGLHLDFGEWVYKDGNWTPVYSVVPLDEPAAVRREVSNQISAFRALMDRNPSHIDSHQHAHLREPARSAALEAALELSVPLRGCSPDVTHCGRFYGQTAEGSPYPDGISSDALIETLLHLGSGINELGCHPGEGEIPNTTYAGERAMEVLALCDPRVRAMLVELRIELCGFAALPSLLTSNAVESPAR